MQCMHYVLLNEFIERLPSFMNCEEGQTAGAIVEAFERRDAPSFKTLLQSNAVRFLDNEVSVAG